MQQFIILKCNINIFIHFIFQCLLKIFSRTVSYIAQKQFYDCIMNNVLRIIVVIYFLLFRFYTAIPTHNILHYMLIFVATVPFLSISFFFFFLSEQYNIKHHTRPCNHVFT